MRVILGSEKVVLMRMEFWGWAEVSSFNYDMYWLLLICIGKVLDLDWGVSILGGALINGGGDYLYMYIMDRYAWIFPNSGHARGL